MWYESDFGTILKLNNLKAPNYLYSSGTKLHFSLNVENKNLGLERDLLLIEKWLVQLDKN